MTLENFFTLTETKDGLTAPDRVEELVLVLQNEKDCALKNVSDASKQWAAVASTITATESKDCLDHFIKLGGHLFINKWLKDAEKLYKSSEISLEDSIKILLRALEKLQIDKERSLSSGIWITVKCLLDHSSLQIQDRARALFDDWNKNDIEMESSVENPAPNPPTNVELESSEVEHDPASIKDENIINNDSRKDVICGSDLQSPKPEEHVLVESSPAKKSDFSIKPCNEGKQEFDSSNFPEEKPLTESKDAEFHAMELEKVEENLNDTNCTNETAPSVLSIDGNDDEEMKDSEDHENSEEHRKNFVSAEISSSSHSGDEMSPGKEDLNAFALNYGIVDALEVARQVAQEVERQVVDYKEPSCSSSSEKILKAGFRPPGSPDSVSGKIGNLVEPTADDPSDKQNNSSRSPSEETHSIQLDQATEVSHDLEVSSEKRLSVLDLNQDLFCDEMDCTFETEAGRSDKSCFHFDLNSSDFPLEDPSLKSTGLEKPSLDLNQSSDDNSALNQSSSSSSIQHLRNFDLNDDPFLALDNDLSLAIPSHKTASSVGSETSDPVFSLFGTKVELGRAESATKNFIPQPPNGKSLTPHISHMGNVLGIVPSLPYSHSQVFGPPNPIPYMLDSRGAPVVPQLMGSSPSLPLPFTQQPFLMNMAASPIALNGMISSRPTFDLNSGSGFPLDINSGPMRQLFMPTQVTPVDEHFPASSSSGANAKRKEPDAGWDPYSLHYRHPPWR